jgi:hypothetical protein
MPRLKSVVLSALFLLASALASAPAFADRDHHRHHHGGHSHLGIYFGAPLYVPMYPPVYVPPRVIVVPPPQPPVYIEQAPVYNGDQYWYYCQQANAYYPQVIDCPSGWIRVPPR